MITITYGPLTQPTRHEYIPQPRRQNKADAKKLLHRILVRASTVHNRPFIGAVKEGAAILYQETHYAPAPHERTTKRYQKGETP